MEFKLEETQQIEEPGMSAIRSSTVEEDSSSVLATEEKERNTSEAEQEDLTAIINSRSTAAPISPAKRWALLLVFCLAMVGPRSD
jgi:hypothetical protein